MSSLATANQGAPRTEVNSRHEATPSPIDDEEFKDNELPGLVRDPESHYNLTLTDSTGARTKTNPKEISLVNRLDTRLLPVLTVMYYLNFIDRAALPNARLGGIEYSLDITPTQYQSCISILFAGYVLMQIPSNYFLSTSRVSPSWYMGLTMAVWAVISACTGLVQNYIGLLLIRLFLGVAEAPFFAGALYMLSSFYTRKEIATRIAILYSANIFALATSGPITAGVFYGLDGVCGMEGWRWLFIIEGIVTFVVAMAAIAILPDTPKTTSWLSPEEKQLADSRIINDTVGGWEEEKSGWASFKELASNWNLWIFAFMQMMHLSSVGYNNYFPSVIKTLGYDTSTSLYLTCPPYILAAIISYGVGLSSGKLNERTWHITIPMVCAIVGFILCASVIAPEARYFSTFLFTSGAYAVNCVILSWVTATLGSTHVKKALAFGVINTFANASYVYSSYLYMKKTEPQYAIAFYTDAGFGTVCLICVWVMRYRIMKLNKRLSEEPLALEGVQSPVQRPRFGV